RGNRIRVYHGRISWIVASVALRFRNRELCNHSNYHDRDCDFLRDLVHPLLEDSLARPGPYATSSHLRRFRGTRKTDRSSLNSNSRVCISVQLAADCCRRLRPSERNLSGNMKLHLGMSVARAAAEEGKQND